MNELFGPSANAVARSVLFLLLLGLAAAAWLSYLRFAESRSESGIDLFVPQPVPFSHLDHAGRLGIACGYCHSSVTRAAFAGMPSVHTCMTCHSQVWTASPVLAAVRESYTRDTPIVWNRVHALPGFVYFDHSIHVTGGISCTRCHGVVESMPTVRKVNAFFMRDCLHCHRTLAAPPDRRRLEDCSGCHR